MLAGCALALACAGACPAADAAGAARIEARSADYVLVGVVQGDLMTIHVSRAGDNAPVRDATVTATLRGAAHPATALADGGYRLQAAELQVPGSAAVEFAVTVEGRPAKLTGTLAIGPGANLGDEKSNVRQLGWWILNFGVCIGFLMLMARRKKRAESKDA